VDDQHERTGGLLAAVETSLAALRPEDRDAALAELVRAYARELDGAAAAEARAHRLARVALEESGGDPTAALYERCHALELHLARRQALDRIGSRLHAGLVELLGTPRARQAGRAKGADDGPPLGNTPKVTRLGELRLASGGDE
jgi:hypothetical protein